MPVRKEATVLLTENIDSRVSPESAQVPQDAPVTFPPRSGQPHRGLYIGLGALIVLFSTPPWPQVQKFQVRHSTRRQQNYLHEHRLLSQPVELTRKASPGP